MHSSCGIGSEPFSEEETERPMALMSWLTDLELLAQAADAKMEMETFSSEDLTRL